MNTLKGKYRPKNPKKYKGDPTNIIHRSSWERRAMKYFDENPAILEWQSEELAIPYRSPEDGQVHRYFPDFVVTVKCSDGMIKTMVLEVKPKAQTKEPKKQKRITEKYIYEVVTWGKNQAKWKAAQEFCADRGWEFKLITEKELGISK